MPRLPEEIVNNLCCDVKRPLRLTNWAKMQLLEMYRGSREANHDYRSRWEKKYLNNPEEFPVRTWRLQIWCLIKFHIHVSFRKEISCFLVKWSKATWASFPMDILIILEEQILRIMKKGIPTKIMNFRSSQQVKQ